MKKLIFLALLLISSVSFAEEDKDVERVRRAMKQLVGNTDKAMMVKLLVSRRNDSLCGKQGEYIIAEFQIQNIVEIPNPYVPTEYRPKFQTIKTFKILASDVSYFSNNALPTYIVDSEDCHRKPRDKKYESMKLVTKSSLGPKRWD